MRRTLLALAFLLAVPASWAQAARPYLDLDFEAPECTSQWRRLGQWWYPYENAVIGSEAHSGQQSLRVKYLSPSPWSPQAGFGIMYQQLPPMWVAGKRVRFSGWIRTEAVTTGYAGFWWTALTGPGTGAGVTMAATGPRGTTGWSPYEVVLDIPANATTIFFGVELRGNGTAWFDGLQVEVDGHALPEGPAPALLEPSPEHAAWLSAHAMPFDTPVAGNGFADLQGLKTAIGDARIVSLGEGTHGTREFFQMKHRLLELLVEEMGFTHFSIEASMPEAYRVNDYVLTGEGDPYELLEGMYFWTWNTQEVLDMILWMRQYNASGKGPVQFTGFDMQASPVAIENTRAFLTLADPGYLPQAETAFAKVAAADQRFQATPDDVAAARGLFAYMSGRRADYLAAGFPEGDVDWAIQNARILVQLVENLARITPRDKSMADNAAWILDHAPAGSKIVLWAHNGHVRKVPGFMGWHLDQRYGDDQYVLGFAYEEGSYTAVGPLGLGTHVTIPPPPGTLETFLGSAGIPRYILDLRNLDEDAPGSWLKRSQRMKSIGAVALRCEGFFPTTVADEYDGLIWIESTSHSVRLPFD